MPVHAPKNRFAGINPHLNSSFAELQTKYPQQFRANESLSRYTVARLGGNAAGVFRAQTRDDLLWVLRWVHTQKIPWLILGGGSNVLASDIGFGGLAIINHAKAHHLDSQTGLIIAESGINLSTLARFVMSDGLKGLEWCVSVPGTLGGAIVNNAGAHGGDMAGNLKSAEILDLHSDQISTWDVAEFHYAYRFSTLKGQHGRYVVISGNLALETGYDPAVLNAIADSFIQHRQKTQPKGASLGSMFKNPPNDYAGRLIEAAGLKGTQIGGVQISPLHANFFINVGGATANDYFALIDLVQSTVRAKFGVELELEVEKIGD